MEYTKGERLNPFGKTELELDLREILREFVKNIDEVRARKDQPDFSKGLDIICDYDEAINKLLERTAFRDMYEALKELHKAFFMDFKAGYSTEQNEALSKALLFLEKAEGR